VIKNLVRKVDLSQVGWGYKQPIFNELRLGNVKERNVFQTSSPTSSRMGRPGHFGREMEVNVVTDADSRDIA